ncbi:MAG: M1 aminopeptidase family protein, partial [Planctomycetota bacterium]
MVPPQTSSAVRFLFLVVLFFSPLFCGSNLFAGEIDPQDGDRGTLYRVHRSKEIDMVHQDLAFDLSKPPRIDVRTSVTVLAKKDGARLFTFGLGPVSSLKGVMAGPKDRLLKTPGPLGHKGLVAVAFAEPLKKGEKRTFRLTYSHARGDWAPRKGFYTPFPGRVRYSFTAAFHLPPGEVAICGPGRLVTFETRDGVRFMKWEAAEPVPPEMFVLERQLFHKKIDGIDYTLVLGEASKANGEAGLQLLSEVMAFLTGLYGPPPRKTLVAYECDRESGTVCNLGGIVEMKKDEFEDLKDPWLAGALAHEIAHEWWGGVVYGSHDNQWVKEAMAELSSIQYGEKKWGLKSAIEDVVINTIAYLGGDRRAVSETKDRLYSKVMLIYRHLMHLMGEEAFFETCRKVLKERAGKTVTHRQFFETAEGVSGKKLLWLLEWLYFTDKDTDFAVKELHWSKKGGKVHSRIQLEERVGRFLYPLEVPVEVKTAKGKTHMHAVRFKKEGAELELVTKSPIVSIAVDPKWMIWDIDRGNNFFGMHVAATEVCPAKKGLSAEVVGGFQSKYRDGMWISLWIRKASAAYRVSFPGTLLGEIPTLTWRAKEKDLSLDFPSSGKRFTCGIPKKGRPELKAVSTGNHGKGKNEGEEDFDPLEEPDPEKLLAWLKSGNADLVL